MACFTVQAKVDKDFATPQGFKPSIETKEKRGKYLIKSKIKNNNDSECSSTELLSLSGQQFVDYIVNNSSDCLSFLFETANAETIYSQTNFVNVANAAVNAAASYDGSTDLSNYFLFLRAGYYIEFYAPQSVSINDAMDTAVISALDAFEGVANFTTMANENHGRLITEWVNAADGSSQWTRYFNTIKLLLADITAFKTSDYSNSIAYNSIMFFLFRGQNNDREGFGSTIVGNDTEIADLLADFILNSNVLNNIEYIANNATLELSRLLQWPNITSSTIPAVQRVIDANERLSQRWMSVVTAIANSDVVTCEQFTGNVCAEGLHEEILAMVFPNEFTFDGGAMVFHTSLSRDEIEQIYYQLKEVEANFFKVTGAIEPVAGDANDTAIFRIYGSRTEYELYQTFLYNLPSGNGGIYIERDATLYTWDREPWENTFSIEELARHEYVHYLNSRYLIPGFWGETEMYQDQRVTWVDEGLANFLAGGTQAEGIKPLKTMLDWVDGRTHYTPEQASTVGYNDQLMYPYSALLFNYLYENKSDHIHNLVNVLRDDDVAGYDTLRTQIGEESASEFSSYINNWVVNVDSIEAPWADDYLPEAHLLLTSSAEVYDSLNSEFNDVLSNLICSDMSAIQWGCEATIDYTVENVEKPLFEISIQVNSLNQSLIDSDTTNLNTANCYAVEVGSSSHTVRCEGGLRHIETEYISNNSAPTTEGLSLSVTEGNSVNGLMPANDVDGDSLTYSATTPSNGSLSYDENTGQFTYTPNSGFTGTDNFTFSVSDGSVDSNESTVTITVNASATNTNNGSNNQSESSSGGGSIWWELLILLTVVLIRKSIRS